MGGRGAYSSGGDGLPSKFRSVLGRKGKPREIDAVLGTANKPRYNDDIAYRINCQRCVWAYELQRRGYKVQARGNDGAGGSFNSSRVFEDLKWDDVKWYKGKGNGVLSLPKSAGGNAKQRNQIVKNIEQKMTEWGEGSRAIVGVGWQKTPQGHVFNVENIGGKAYIVDAQVGKKLPLRDYINKARVLGVQIARTDNLRKPNYDMLKQAVKPL